jgi:hypothetical protein
MNDLSFLLYGVACVSLTLFGLLLTVLEFHRMSPARSPIERREIWTTKLQPVNKVASLPKRGPAVVTGPW